MRRFIAVYTSIILITVIPNCVLAQDKKTPALETVKNLISDTHGFIEYGYGFRVGSDDRQKHCTTYHETRLQLELSKQFDTFEFQIKKDITYDAWEGTFDLDLREAYVYLFPLDWVDLKIGRQILTWGTGDFLFLNDLFPKDWQSFFIGREDEYLKAPSTALKVSAFPELFGQEFVVDFVWMPVFEHDRFIVGERISYFNTLLNDKAGFKRQVHFERPDRTFDNSVFAARISKNFSGTETALYFYKGFFTRPLGFDFNAWRNIFPQLAVYGTSVRGAVLNGIGNMEIAYYDSMDDSTGDDPFIENSVLKGLVGYTRELKKDLTMGLQYYVEYMMDYGNYRSSYPLSEIRADQARQVVTLRLTQLMMLQTLRLSFFTFYSPTDEDAYIRPSLNYKINDNLDVTCGGNIFVGREEHTFFGQLEDNTNLFARIRYSF